MIDAKKRQTLKGMAAVAGATAVGLPTFAASASLSNSAVVDGSKTVRQVWPPIAVNSPIKLSTRVSAINNDIEVVLTNKTSAPVTMTQLSPSTLSTPRGTFDLAKLLNKGPRQLAAGESISVSIKHHAIENSANSLQSVMRTGLSITTEENQFAAVSYAVVG